MQRSTRAWKKGYQKYTLANDLPLPGENIPASEKIELTADPANCPEGWFCCPSLEKVQTNIQTDIDTGL